MVKITEYENIKRIEASVGGYFGSSYTFAIEFVTGWMNWEERGMGILESGLNEQITAEGINSFKKELSKCRILNWKNEYIDRDTIDGTQWTLDIQLEDRNIHISGSNEYPKEWAKFCKCIRKVTNRNFE
jgi:hypothetical protein